MTKNTTDRERKPLTREQELERAIDQAAIPRNDYSVLRALFRCAEWKTGIIKDDWQPSLAKLVRESHVSRNTVLRALSRLQAHGWVSIARGETFGLRNHYTLDIGTAYGLRDLDMRPMTDAERARKHRRRKAEGVPSNVTEGVPSNVTGGATVGPVGGANGRDDFAGQGISPLRGEPDVEKVRGDRGELRTCDMCQPAYLFEGKEPAVPKPTVLVPKERGTETIGKAYPCDRYLCQVCLKEYEEWARQYV